jgi:23S rRNA pseudouridine1911/1915/1917 synthase
MTIEESAGDRPFFGQRASAWPRRLKQGPVRMIEPSELASWIVYEDGDLVVVNKPGDVVCHPSKAGPWSSLVSAVREHAGLDTAHLVFRLDRETSGVVVLAKHPKAASRLQKAMQNRKVGKTYLAILTGELERPISIDQPLGDDTTSAVFMKSAVVEGGQPSITHFEPLAVAKGDSLARKGVSLARVVTETGRKHQIRAHAQWMGHSLVGDKIYGPDAQLFLDFIDQGWTQALEEKLFMPRQALHCFEIDLRMAGWDHVFRAPLAADMTAFLATRGLTVPPL